jgi:uncharacterized membrane protein
MKRLSPLLFIWIFCFIGAVFFTYLSYYEGNTNETIAWMTSSSLAASLITYHFLVTSKQKK